LQRTALLPDTGNPQVVMAFIEWATLRITISFNKNKKG